MPDVREVDRLTTADPLIRWAAQDLARARAFTDSTGSAVAVASPGLSMRDRLAVQGPAEAVIPLVRDVLRDVGPTYRPLGDRELIDALVAALPGLRPVAGFGWMDRTQPLAADHGGVGWLPPAAAPGIATLLDGAFPDSYARPSPTTTLPRKRFAPFDFPGRPGVRRWAGVRDPRTGRLAAVAAHAWSAPTVGFIAGVATHSAARGQGLGRAVCTYVIAEALARHGTAALVVDDDNEPALRLYRALGLAYRPLRAASHCCRAKG
jgi:GNAT superfamily N-acetyltransferase